MKKNSKKWIYYKKNLFCPFLENKNKNILNFNFIFNDCSLNFEVKGRCLQIFTNNIQFELKVPVNF